MMAYLKNFINFSGRYKRCFHKQAKIEGSLNISQRQAVIKLLE